ncbi:nuclear protein UL24 [Leporid alphaherpesvirus 4]|uniref:Nuclear protein UL24 n=1 Tax=Leporid alphaherpesvirus 4 TaxID=481315 RepID=J9QQS4_9ALPH|nr:nuclear protein UL24 [Leporid alphaherpesvirus 4]AFR32466.1 nuclear protein UL24 [Leporid alphaherpesvirus 4]
MASSRMRKINRRSILLAGMRSHVKFYKAFDDDVRAFNTSGMCGPILQLMERSLQGQSIFDAAQASLICEVNLGSRRPDCICVLDFSDRAGLGGVCVIVELKTCRYVSATETARKREQRETGMSQLRDSVKLIRDLVAPGSRPIYLCPVLIFVTQKTLRVIRITRLAPRMVHGDVKNTVMTLKGLSTYTVPSAAAPRPASKKRSGKPKRAAHRAKASAAPEQAPNVGGSSKDKPANTARAADVGVLQKIAALFCVAPRS